jgi:spore coat protein A
LDPYNNKAIYTFFFNKILEFRGEKILKNKVKIAAIMLFSAILVLSSMMTVLAAPPVPAGLLDPTTIPKYVNQLVANIPVYTPTDVTDGSSSVIRQDYTITMTTLNEEILPVGTPVVGGLGLGPNGAPLTHVWGYSGLTNVGVFANSPSATFIATTGIPTKVTWINAISEPQFLPVDPTIHWANPLMMPMNMPGTAPGILQPFPAFPGTFTTTEGPLNAQTPVPLVPHLHGAEVQSFSDGGPEAWFTYNSITGPTYSSNNVELGAAGASNQAVYNYPNTQNPATLWYHDHALGMTRLNVISGLAGFYLLKDPAAESTITTPVADGSDFDQYMSQTFTYGVNEIPLAIQDRTFSTDGSLWFPSVGINPTINPYWMPEFFGNTIMVNGKVWPNLDVTQGAYRFRILDGSNARFYTLELKDQTTGAKIPFTVIGSDGGYLQQPATLKSLTIAPGERYDIIVDFSAIAVGTRVIMTNMAKAPFPSGQQPDPQTTGQVMQFTIAGTATVPGSAADNIGAATPVLPANLNPTLPAGAFPTIANSEVTKTRTRTLYEVMGPNGPVMVTVNGQLWDGDISENPENGATEDWIIVNLTGDTHPIHLHLVTFQLLSRQSFKVSKYTTQWLANNALGAIYGNGMPPFMTDWIPIELSPAPYLQGKPTGAQPQEMGWKDTVQMNPGEVTIIRVHFGSNTGNAFSFDPTQGPGYVWHCHIIDHEDNEMMRPYVVT